MQKPQVSKDLIVLVKSLKKEFLETEFSDISCGLDSQAEDNTIIFIML